MIQIPGNASLAVGLIGISIQYLIPFLFDIFIISYVAKIQKNGRLIIAALIANVLASIGSLFFSTAITSAIKMITPPVDTALVEIRAFSFLTHSMIIPFMIAMGLVISAIIKIPTYRQFIREGSVKDISLAVLSSVLIYNIIVYALMFTLFYFLYPLTKQV